MTQPHTIFVHDTDGGSPVRIVMDYTPQSMTDVWLHVLRHFRKDVNIQLDDVPAIVDDLGEDLLDWTIVAVVPGAVDSVLSSLTDD